MTDHPQHELEHGELLGKGLATGRVGTFSGAILGISCVAPGYTLTASIGLIVAAVGLKMPAIFIAGFIPMFLTAYAYRELNSDEPGLRRVVHLVHQGVRALRGLDVRLGHGARDDHRAVQSRRRSRSSSSICSSRTCSTTRRSPTLPDNKFVQRRAPRWCSSRSPPAIAESRHHHQRAACSSCWSASRWCCWSIFAVVALVHVGAGTPRPALSFTWDWFNPFTGLTLSARSSSA